MSEPCLCGAEDCRRCFPHLRVKDTDYDPDPDWPDDEAADRAAGRWEDERTRQAERRGCEMSDVCRCGHERGVHRNDEY